MKNNFSIRSCFKLLLGILLAVSGVCSASTAFANPFSYIKNNPDGSQILTGHVPSFVQNGTAVLKSHASQTITAQIIMPVSNQSGLSSLLQSLYDPSSPNFHHFLTPTQFAQQFTASTVDAAFVQESLAKQGIVVTGRSPNGTVLYVTGSVSAFEKMFGLQINNYQKNDGTAFFAPNADPVIPASLAGKILAVGGLDNLPKYQGHLQAMAGALPKAVGSGPGGYLAPSDVKTAYNLNAVGSTGAGQNVALFELDGYQAKDITAYESKFSLPNVPLQNTLLDGFNGTPNYNAGAPEVTLDIELVAAFAPGSSSILVYEAPNTTQSWIDEWTKIASDNKAKVISCSWGEPELDSPTLSFDYSIFQQMAAQGQAVFVAAGDNGAFDAGGKTLAVDEPASQPYVTAVGISKLTTTSSGAYSSETASVYGGGGVSSKWTIPAYQTAMATSAVKAAMVSTTMRNLPDVVLTADAATPYAFYINGGWAGYYGSSIAAPIWASFMSLVNQGLGANAPVGSVNSALYKLAQGANYANDFHDINTGNNGYYPAEPGFDDATGLGSFNGLNLFKDLVNVSVGTTAPAVPTGLSATAGNAQVSLSWTASLGATSYNVKRSTVSGGSYATIASGTLNTTYTDSSVSNGTTYYYVVSAVNTAGQSANSAQVSALSTAPAAVAAPTNLSGTVSTYSNQPAILLQWTHSVSPNILKYNVYRSTGTATPTLYGSIGASYTGAYDTNVSAGTTYNYYMTAVNTSNVESVASVKVTVAMPAPAVVLPPSALSASLTSVGGKPAALLKWTQSSSPSIKSENVYYSTGSSTSYVLLGSVSATTTVTVTGLSNGVTYNFYVTAVNATNVQSIASNKVSIVG